MHSGQTTFIAVAIVTGIALILVILRFAARFIHNKWGWEDALMLGAIITSVGFTFCLGMSLHYGLGTKFSWSTIGAFITWCKWAYVSGILCVLGMTFAKMSIVVQLLRIFVSRTHKILCWASLAGVFVSGTYATFALVFICTPIAYYWDKSLPNGSCRSFKFTLIPYVINFTGDLVVWALPLYVFKSLQMPRRQKFFLILVFGLGIFCCITPVVRLVESLRMAQLIDHGFVLDIREKASPVFLWTSLEVNTAIICGNIPMLTPLINRFWPNLLTGGKQKTPVLNHIPNSNFSTAPTIQASTFDSTLASRKASTTSEKGFVPLKHTV